MHKAIIHIGTEKTGSTSIQNFLFRNRKELAKSQIFFPHQTCGVISNYRLVLYALNKPDKGLCGIDRKSVLATLTDESQAEFEQWKEQFDVDHKEQIQSLQKGLKSSTIVYSSEHFHSRTREPEELERLKSIIEPLYDSIQIVVYLRRQDRLAISARNTAIQGGNKQKLDFDSIKGVPAYYDYGALVNRWANAFGQDNITPKVFSRKTMFRGDVIEDFAHHFLNINADRVTNAHPNSQYQNDAKRPMSGTVSAIKSSLGKKNNTAENANKEVKKRKQHANTRLCYTALSALLEFNNLEDNDSLLQGQSKAILRQRLINELHHLEDEYGELLPSRASAISFYERFKDANNALCAKWKSMDTFTEDFEKYPSEAHEHPDVDARAALVEPLNVVIAELESKSS